MTFKIRFKLKTFVLYRALFLFLICYFNSQIKADYVSKDWQSTRAAGMGNAFAPWANEGAAIFYNPAGISLVHNRLSKYNIWDIREPLPDEIEVNYLYGSKLSTPFSHAIDEFFQAAQTKTNQASYLAIQAFPYVIFGGKNTPTFLIGFPLRSETSAVFTDTTHPTYATLKSINTASLAFTIADSTPKGNFRWGLTIRPNIRSDYSSSTFDIQGKTFVFENFYKQIIEAGEQTNAVAIDAGFMATVSDFWYPTFAFSIRNIPTGCVTNYLDSYTNRYVTMCGTKRTKGTDTSPNESRLDPTEMHAGVSLIPRGRIFGTMINVRLSADAYPLPIQIGGHHFGYSRTFDRVIHVGSEFFLGSPFARSPLSLTAGYMNKALSLGATLQIGLFYLTYSNYVENSSQVSSSNQLIQETERRHLLSLLWEL